MTIYQLYLDSGVILEKMSKDSNPKWGVTEEQLPNRKAYEAEDNQTATNFTDLVNPVDVTSKRIYLVE